MLFTDSLNTNRLLSLLLTALERQPLDLTQIQDLLPLLIANGAILQTRLLCTASPYSRRVLPMLPEPDFFAECWPGSSEQWSTTLPSSEEHPYFSVVTPSYNQGVYLRQTIESVLRQNFVSYEHIIMDGGSTDDTLAVLRSYPHLRWTSEADKGQTDALNKALRQARGEVIAWINTDDFYLPETFTLVQRFFEQNPEENLVTGDSLWGWEGSGRLRYISGEERDFESLIRQWNSHVPGPQPSIFFKRRLLEEVGLPDPHLHYAMDYDLWLRMAKAGYVRRHIHIPVAFYRFHSLSKSGDQQDWSPFYAEWHACFTRYRHHSQLLPREVLLNVAYPLRMHAPARERAALCSAISLCTSWKLRDLEVLLLTDMPHVKEEYIAPGTLSEQLQRWLPGLSAQSLPLRVLPLPSLDTESFVKTVVQHCKSFAVCMPPISPAIPFEQWYVRPLGELLDNPSLSYTPLVVAPGRLPAHPLLSPAGACSCLAMHRRSALEKMFEERL